VTLYHLPCRFATLDIVDVMGTHFQNVSTNIIKTRVETDAEGRGVSTLGRRAQWGSMGKHGGAVSSKQ